MNSIKNDAALRSYLLKESKRLNISIGNAYNTFFSRNLLERLSKIDYKEQIIIKGSFAQFVNLQSLVRPITDIDLTTTINHHDPLILLVNAMCMKDGIMDFDYILRGKPKRTKTGIIKFPISAKYGKINHPIGIDYREKHNCIYEKRIKEVPKIFSVDNLFEVIVPSYEETLAEKLCIVAESTKENVLNTRTKDFYDIYHLYNGKYDYDKFCYYFEKMIIDRNKVKSISMVDSAYLNKHFIDNHKEVWENNKIKYEFLENDFTFEEAVYYTKNILDLQYEKIKKGKNKVYKI